MPDQQGATGGDASDLVGVIASGIVIAEREFSANVGRGAVPPGDYLSDRDKASEIMGALSRAGYKIVKIEEDGS